MSLNYLNAVSSERKRKKKQKKQARTQPQKKFKIKEDPPFGVLKGGRKPLYRDYMKTLKKNNNEGLSIVIHEKNEKKKEPTERQKKLKKFRKKIKKRNFTIGRNLKKRKIGVLIKNKTVRKKIEDKKSQLKTTHIHEVKKYLRNHGFIKAGTPAPEDITRTMYEDAISAGEIYNKSGEILLHNYLHP